MSKSAWMKANPEKVKLATAKWRLKNPEKVKGWDRARYQKHAEKIKTRIAEWGRRNPEKRKAYCDKWDSKNVDKKRAYVRTRQAIRRNAVPSWANIENIQKIYAQARAAEVITGIPHDVDHIVPLQSKIVCGLHCEANLQVLPSFDNGSKSNRFWPDMPA